MVGGRGLDLELELQLCSLFASTVCVARYGVAYGYVLCDTIDKTYKTYKVRLVRHERGKLGGRKKGVQGGDRLSWPHP
jgi:hypothetical protein